jgi:hypothetical protein
MASVGNGPVCGELLFTITPTNRQLSCARSMRTFILNDYFTASRGLSLANWSMYGSSSEVPVTSFCYLIHQCIDFIGERRNQRARSTL